MGYRTQFETIKGWLPIFFLEKKCFIKSEEQICKIKKTQIKHKPPLISIRAEQYFTVRHEDLTECFENETTLLEEYEKVHLMVLVTYQQ